MGYVRVFMIFCYDIRLDSDLLWVFILKLIDDNTILIIVKMYPTFIPLNICMVCQHVKRHLSMFFSNRSFLVKQVIPYRQMICVGLVMRE